MIRGSEMKNRQRGFPKQKNRRTTMVSNAHTIAVVDDDLRTCETLKQMIEASSPEYSVVCAHDGKQGLAMIRDQKPDMVILDIDMPRMNGLAVLKKLKTSVLALNVPIVMLTGSSNKEYAARSTYWYADAYLTKPCSREKLLATVGRSMSYRASIEERRNAHA
jgi:DNA-binding response OmpR family regulator